MLHQLYCIESLSGKMVEMVEYHNGYFLKMLTILNISTLLIDQDAVHDTIATFLRGYHNGLMVEMVERLNG